MARNPPASSSYSSYPSPSSPHQPVPLLPTPTPTRPPPSRYHQQQNQQMSNQNNNQPSPITQSNQKPPREQNSYQSYQPNASPTNAPTPQTSEPALFYQSYGQSNTNQPPSPTTTTTEAPPSPASYFQPYPFTLPFTSFAPVSSQLSPSAPSSALDSSEDSFPHLLNDVTSWESTRYSQTAPTNAQPDSANQQVQGQPTRQTSQETEQEPTSQQGARRPRRLAQYFLSNTVAQLSPSIHL